MTCFLLYISELLRFIVHVCLGFVFQNQDAAIDSSGCEHASLAASALICLLAQSCSASVLWATVDALLQWEHAQQRQHNASGQRVQLPLNWIGPAMCLIQALQSPLNISAPFPMMSVQSFNSPISNSKGGHDNLTMTVSQCGSYLYVLSARGLEQLHTGYQSPSLSQLTAPSTVKMGSVVKCVPYARSQEIGCQICCGTLLSISVLIFLSWQNYFSDPFNS
jgi:hypothetical protein